MNGLNNVEKTDREYSLAPTDDLIRFWRSQVKGQGHSRPKYVAMKASTLTLGRWNRPSSSFNNMWMRLRSLTDAIN